MEGISLQHPLHPRSSAAFLYSLLGYLVLAWKIIGSWPDWFAHAFSVLISLALLALVAGFIRGGVVRGVFLLTISSAVWLIHILELQSYFLAGTSFDERFFSHLDLSTVSAAFTAYPLRASGSVAVLVVMVVLSTLVLQRLSCRGVALRMPTIAAAIALLSWHSAYASLFDVMSLRSQSESTLAEIFHKHGLPSGFTRPGDILAKPGKNLVLIYLESVEANYLNEAVFPGLLPNIKRLRDESLSWGNFQQIYGAEWTIGGIFSSQCGLPLLSQSPGNHVMSSMTSTDVGCLADVLGAAGYRQVFMGGANVEFAGKGNFLRIHGYDEVLGKKEILSQHSVEQLSPWGLYDRDLIELAKNKYLELSEAGAPFNLTLLTLDTHHPLGHADSRCKPYAAKDKSLLHAVHCTDQLLGDFVSFLRAQPNAADTTVFVMSDHLAMRTILDDSLRKAGSPRRILAFSPPMLPKQAAQGVSIEYPMNHLDVPPIVLQLMEVEHNATYPFSAAVEGGGRQITPLALNFYDENMHADFRKVFGETHRIEAPVCNTGLAFRYEKGQGIVARFGGISRPVRTPLGESYALEDWGLAYISFDAQGQLRDMAAISRADLVRALKAPDARDGLHLVLARTQVLPEWLVPPGSTETYTAYFGNPYKMNAEVVVSGDEPDALRITSGQCSTISSASETDFRFSTMFEQLDELELELASVRDSRDKLLEYLLQNTDSLTLQASSVGYDAQSNGRRSGVLLGEKFWRGGRGLNVVEFSTELDEPKAYNFDTHGSREAIEGFVELLESRPASSRLVIFARDDAAYQFMQADRERFSSMGLKRLAKLQYREAYLAHSNIDGRSFTEQSGESNTPIEQIVTLHLPRS